MKTIKSVLAALIVFAALFMVSCDKEETATSFNIDKAKKGTIKGYLWAELDLTSAGFEPAPEGTKVIITVPNDDINPYASGTYVDTVEVDENGVFEVQVPVGNGNAYVSVYPQPFEAIQVQPFGSAEAEVMKIFTYDYLTKAGSYDSWYISANQTVIAQFEYTAFDYAGYVPMAQVSGTIYAQLNYDVAGLETLPAGIQITFHGEGWSETVTTGTDGTYSLEVPQGLAIQYSYSFVTNVVNAGTDSYLFESNNVDLGTFSGVNTDEDITLNDGTPE